MRILKHPTLAVTSLCHLTVGHIIHKGANFQEFIPRNQRLVFKEMLSKYIYLKTFITEFSVTRENQVQEGTI